MPKLRSVDLAHVRRTSPGGFSSPFRGVRKTRAISCSDEFARGLFVERTDYGIATMTCLQPSPTSLVSREKENLQGVGKRSVTPISCKFQVILWLRDELATRSERSADRKTEQTDLP